jgi:uncharacterized protein (TIGR02466 family)
VHSLALADLQLRPLFPVALGQVQLKPDPLDLALQMQAIRQLQAGAASNPDPGSAWTGDLNRVWQLHRHPVFAPLLRVLMAQALEYLENLGFDPAQLALHLQRCWPVVSELGQVVGRHHHPNAHLSGVYYLNGDGSGRSGCLRFYPAQRSNELVPGLATGHTGPLLWGSSALERWNAPWSDIAPRAGLLLLFPSSLDHAVLENEDEDDSRFSISFDLALSAPRASQAEPSEYLAPHPADWLSVGPSDPEPPPSPKALP